MKKIWKTWKPRKKEKEGNQELHFIQHPENESTKCLYMCPRKLRRLLRLHRTAQPPRTPTYIIS